MEPVQPSVCGESSKQPRAHDPPVSRPAIAAIVCRCPLFCCLSSAFPLPTTPTTPVSLCAHARWPGDHFLNVDGEALATDCIEVEVMPAAVVLFARGVELTGANLTSPLVDKVSSLFVLFYVCVFSSCCVALILCKPLLCACLNSHRGMYSVDFVRCPLPFADQRHPFQRLSDCVQGFAHTSYGARDSDDDADSAPLLSSV